MTWQPVDCHAHSTYSDGALTVAEVVERARQLGVRPSLADHISRDVARASTPSMTRAATSTRSATSTSCAAASFAGTITLA